MRDSIVVNLRWLVLNSLSAACCGPETGTCKRTVVRPCTQPACVETIASWDLWISTHARGGEGLPAVRSSSADPF